MAPGRAHHQCVARRPDRGYTVNGMSEARRSDRHAPAWLALILLGLGLSGCNHFGPHSVSAPAASSAATAERAAPPGHGYRAEPPPSAPPPAPVYTTTAAPSAEAGRHPARGHDASTGTPQHAARPTSAADRHDVQATAAAAAEPAPRPLTADDRSAAGAGPNLDAYTARVSATAQIELPGSKGSLVVWIGLPQNLPEVTSDMASSTESLGMGGQTAKITPFAPDFDVEPRTTVCERLVPSGSVVRFSLVPHHTGDLTVGADVQLYDSADCSGTPTPKSTKAIHVQVRVCQSCYVKSGAATLGAEVWNAFTKFWAWLVGLVFATLVVLINRWRSRRFGIPADDKPK